MLSFLRDCDLHLRPLAHEYLALQARQITEENVIGRQRCRRNAAAASAVSGGRSSRRRFWSRFADLGMRKMHLPYGAIVKMQAVGTYICLPFFVVY